MQLVRPFPLAFSNYTTSVAENDADPWNSATTYALGDRVIRDHRVYVSTVDGANQDNDPALENQRLTSARWLLIGYTNAYRFIDGTIGNRTTAETDVIIDVEGAAGAAAVLIFGVSATSVFVQGFDAADAEVYSELVSLSGREVYTYFEWFTEPLGERGTKVFLTDLPSDIDALRFTFSGDAIEIGELVIGSLLSIGQAVMQGTEGEVRSYARVEFNDYGQLTQIDGPTRTTMRYRVLVPKSEFPVIKDMMDRLAGTLVGAIGSANRASTVQLGILGTVRWPENLPNHYIFQFQVDGVT